MKAKGIFLILISCLTVALLISLFVLFYFYKNTDNSAQNSNSNSVLSANNPVVNTPNSPSNTPSNNNSVSNSAPSSPSQPSAQIYVSPDYSRLKNILANQQLIKDVPKSGKISLRFYHFSQGNRIWDKNYLLSGGYIEEKEGAADIDIWISSIYVNKITENNLCEVISQARNNGDLGQWTNIGDVQLMWTYKGMLKYKDCLGL